MPHAIGSRRAYRGGSRVARKRGTLCQPAVVLGATWLIVVCGAGSRPAGAQAMSGLKVAAAGDFRLEIAPAGDVNLTPATRRLSDLSDVSRIRPKLRGNMSTGVRRTLGSAFSLAVERVNEKRTCGDLFRQLGSSGVDTLAVNRYVAASWNSRFSGCQPGVVAFAYVGSPQTRLCSGFARLSTDEAALVLIHEALHSAGLTERPIDPDGLSSEEIHLMVRQSCGP